jgi:hypothetical protein
MVLYLGTYAVADSYCYETCLTWLSAEAISADVAGSDVTAEIRVGAMTWPCQAVGVVTN